MKYFFISVILFIEINALLGQAPYSISDCENNSVKYSELFIRYLNNENIDSLNSLFRTWQVSCGMCEPLQRAKIVASLKLNNYSDTVLADSVSCKIMTFLDRKKISYIMNEEYFSYIPIGKKFDRFTDSIAKSLLKNYKKKSIEYLLCEVYGNLSDSILIKIKNPIYSKSKIHKNPCDIHIVSKKNVIAEKPGFTAALMTGIWIPTGGLTKLGVHPEFGFQFGSKKADYSLQFTLIVKFLKSQNTFSARRIHSNDSLENTRVFVGPYVGIDFGKSVYSNNKSEVQLLAGIGFDAFTVLYGDKIRDLFAEDARSYNINFGLGYKYYLRRRTYGGVELKFNLVDYTLSKTITQKGDFFSIRFIYGFLDNRR